MSSPEPQEVDVPAAALVECPLVQFNLRPVAKCTECPKFDGLEDRFPGMAKLEFQKRYLLRCFGEPVKRQMRMLCEE